MINLTVVIDNDEALKKLKELQKVAKQSTSSVVSDAERMDSAFNSVKGSIAELAGAAALGSFVNKVIQVRGEVQQLEVAFETMLGSKAKAEALMADVINLAAKTPFGLQDVSNATKMLLAYGSTAESVADEIKMLGNIASGLSIPLNDMIYLYGTTRTQGRMFSNDLRQFMGRGIPLAEELATQFGVAKDEVDDLVTAGKVGFPEMQKALQSMTSEGGQFFNLMDKQSQTIAGQISNLEDSIYQMFNAIGESQQETISKGISLASSLVENYEKVIGVISHLVIVYGSYKAAVMTVAAARTVASTLKMVKTMYDLAKGAQTAAAAFNLLKGSIKGWVGLIAGVLSSIGILMMDFGIKTENAADAAGDLADEMGELEKAAREEYETVIKLAYEYKHLTSSEKERQEIAKKLKDISPDLVKGMDNEADALDNLTTNVERYCAAQLKSIQLAALTDKQKAALSRQANAQADKAIKEAEAREILKQMSVDIATGAFSWKDVKLVNTGNLKTAITDAMKKQVFNKIKSLLGQVTDENALGIAEQIAKVGYSYKTNPFYVNGQMISNSYSYQFSDAKTKGGRYNLEKLLGEMAGLDKEIKKAGDDIQFYTRNAGDILKALGFETNPYEDKNKGGEGGDTTPQYIEARKKAYKEWVAELQRLQKIESGAIKATTKDYEEQKKKEEEARKAYEALGGSTKKTTKTTKPTTIDEDLQWINEWAAEVDKEALKATEELEKRLQDRGKSWDDYLIQFGTFKERWAATERKFDRDIREAETDGERKALEAERDAALAAFEVQANEWAQDLANKSVSALNELITKLEGELKTAQSARDALDSSDSEEAKKYQQTINELTAKIAHLKTLVKDAGEEVKEGNWDESVRVFQEIISTAKDAASSLSEVDESLGKMATGLVDLASFGLNAVTAIKKVGEAAGGIEKASAILTVISLGVQLVSGIVSRLINANKEYKETIENFKALNKELEQMHRLANINSLEGTIFGEDAFGNFVNNLNVMREASKAYSESIEDVAKAEYNMRKAMIEGAMAQAGLSGDSIAVNYYKELLGELEASEAASRNLFDSLAKMEVKLSKRKSSTLAEQLPELFAGGEVTLEGLQKLQQSDVWDKLSKENRDLIEQMIADWEYYNESVGAVNDYLKDIFGDFGETMTNILVDSFNEGTDAALEFGDAMADIIDRLTKEFIYSAFIKDFVDDAQAQVDALNEEDISGEEKVKRLVGILKQLSNDVLGAQEDVNATLEELEAEGVSVDRSSGQQSASSGGFQTMSQETGSELNGRFTDIQGKVTYINEAVQFMKSLSASQLQQTTSISETVALIRNDTTRIEQHTRVLGQMAADIASIKSDISNGGY